MLTVRLGTPSLEAGDQARQKFFQNETDMYDMYYPDSFSMNLQTSHHLHVFPAQILSSSLNIFYVSLLHL